MIFFVDLVFFENIQTGAFHLDRLPQLHIQHFQLYRGLIHIHISSAQFCLIFSFYRNNIWVEGLRTVDIFEVMGLGWPEFHFFRIFGFMLVLPNVVKMGGWLMLVADGRSRFQVVVLYDHP